VAHRPAGSAQHPCDASIAVTAVRDGERDDVGGQCRLIIARLAGADSGIFAPPLRPFNLVRCTSGLHDGPLIGRTESPIETGQRGLDEPRFESHPGGLAVGIKLPGHSQRRQALMMVQAS